MAIPQARHMLYEFLYILKDESTFSYVDIEEKITERFHITQVEREQFLPSGNQTRIQNRIAWTAFFLNKAEFIKKESRGIHSITKKGIDYLSKNNKLSIQDLLKIESFYNWKKNIGGKNSNQTIVEDDEPPMPINLKTLEVYHGILLKQVNDELLIKIKDLDPEKFEELILDLMKNMGYGIEHSLTQKSHDGGIDGIIKEDKLGLREIFLQAKKYENPVPQSHVRDFVGSLQAKRNKIGVFITTSSFTRETYDYLRQTDSNVILIDGDLLTKYMIEYDTGIKTVLSLPLKIVDEAYFLD